MSELILMKVLSDLCVICAVIGSFPMLLIHDFLLLYPAGICAAGAGLAAYFFHRGKPGWVKWMLVFPVSCLLFADTLLEAAILLPLIGYTAAVILRGSFALDYYTFREQFVHTGVGLSVFGGVVFALGFFEGMFGNSWSTYDVSAVLFYGLIFAFLGVFMMRQLRLGADCQRSDRLRNHIQMAIVLIVILSVTLLIVFAEDMLHDTISWLLTTIMAVIGFIPVVILEILRWFMDDGGREYQDALEQVKPTTVPTTEYTYPPMEGTGEVVVPQEGSPWVLVALILIVMCIVLIFLLRSMNRGTSGEGSSEMVEEVEPGPVVRKESRRSNRYQVRKLYRNYLKLIRRKGQRLRTDQTSLDILEGNPEDLVPASADTIRRIYIKARYCPTAEITNSDVAQMRQALAGIMKHKM